MTSGCHLHGPDHIGEHFVLVPDFEGLVGVLGEAEVVGTAEKLGTAIGAAGGKQFLRADDAEQFLDLRADEVLAAIATGERRGRPCSCASRWRAK